MSDFPQQPTVKNEDEIVTGELEHINQEMYKKSAELAESNRTLSLLQKINEIILGSITHPDEIAKLVTYLLVSETDFQLVCILLYDSSQKKLRTLSVSESGQTDNNIAIRNPYPLEIPLSATNNIIVKAITEKAVKYADNLEEVLVPKGFLDQAENKEKLTDLNYLLIYPLIVRNESTGAMVIGLKDSKENLSDYRKSLIERLVELIGIAIDNALLYTEVQASNVRLRELDKLKDEFVSLASHELRTPMSAIKSYLWVVLQQGSAIGTLNEKQKLYLERTYASTDRLIKLVNNMLNVSRIESGRMQVTPKPTDLVNLVKDTVLDVAPAAKEQGIELVVVEPEQKLPNVLSDSDKIKQVIINLIGNSLKFTPSGGKVTISFSQQGDKVITSITDTGKGIKAEDLPKLFQKFGMIEGNYIKKDSQTSGTGLGLYICKTIVQLHGGSITVSSDGENKGTTFSFSLKKAGLSV